MADAHTNFAYSLVATAPSPATSGTSLVVTAAQGALFPAVPFNATIWPTAAQPLSTNSEIVRVTGRSTDTLTITRAQEGTSARTVVVGDQIAATITAKSLTDIETSVGMVKLSGSTLGSPAANFDITSISGAYSHLRLMFMGATSDSAEQYVQVTFNNDTGSNYDTERFFAQQTIVTPAEGLGIAFIRGGVIPASTATSRVGSYNVDIPFYSGTTLFKTTHSYGGLSDSGSTGGILIRGSFGTWRSTAAITRITLTPTAGNFITGSAYTLYGIL